MGGHANGHVASKIVKETLQRFGGELGAEVAIQKAHETISSSSVGLEQSQQMGATVVAAQISPGSCKVAWVGDSRAYLKRGKSLRLLTRDHSYLELLRREQGLSEKEAREHPNKNLVTQTLGIGRPVASVGDTPLRTHDWIVLCSDGLNDELTDREIAKVLEASASPELAAESLINAALAHGGKDNVSVVVVEYDGPSGVGYLRALDQDAVTWVALIGGAASAVLAAFLWWWWGFR
jgi:protein phosphatase